MSNNNLWAIEWHSHNRLDGDNKHIIYQNYLPVLFRTRKAARLFIKEKYGYIKDRPDLKREPHGWRMPTAIKVKIVKVED
jgi:hypothetical protein